MSSFFTKLMATPCRQAAGEKQGAPERVSAWTGRRGRQGLLMSALRTLDVPRLPDPWTKEPSALLVPARMLDVWF